MTQAEAWSKPTKQIFTGVLLYSAANVLYSILDPIRSLGSLANTVSSFTGGGNVVSTGPLDIFCYLLLIAIIGGYVMFLMGLGDFKKILDNVNAGAVGNIWLGAILSIASYAWSFLPFLGWLSGIIWLVGLIFMIMGYSTLKSSATFPVQARNGASKLFIASILSLVGIVIAWIPLIGWIITAILSVIVFFLTLSGWASIKNSSPNVA